MAKLLLANASLHADDNDAHDLIVGFGDVSVVLHHAKDQRVGVLSPAERHVPTWELLEAQQSYDWYTRAASRAPCGLVKEKETPARDGATTVEAVPITFMHNDGYVATVHGDDFIAAGSQQGLDSLKHTMENNFRTKLMGKIGPNCRQKSGSPFRKAAGVVDAAYWWKPGPRSASRSFACLEARRPRRLARKDTVKNVHLSGRLCHSLDGPTLHLEMMVMLVVCKPNGRSNGKADAGGTHLHCQAALMEWMLPTPLMRRRASGGRKRP